MYTVFLFFESQPTIKSEFDSVFDAERLFHSHNGGAVLLRGKLLLNKKQG